MPRPETVSKALAEISKSAANYRYFFDSLKSPEWLAPLAERGLFTTPPEKEQVEGGVAFPGWPASQYLARMATNPAAQQEVLKITLAMRETDNINVHRDLLDIALALPASDAAKLTGRARAWVQSPYRGMVDYKIGDLIAHLAAGGEVGAALQLAKDTFALLPSAPAGEETDAEWALLPEPRAWLEDWHYEEALKKAIPPLVTADARRALGLLTALLARALELSRGRSDSEHEDYSYIWHDAIEQDEHPPRLRNSLISAVRNAADQAIRADPNALGIVLEVVRRQDWPVFKRIELHLLREHADRTMQDIVAMAPTLVELEGSTRHEAALLLRNVFEMLPPATQEELLERIEAGPEFIGAQPTPEKIAEYRLRWRAQRFSLVADHLPQAWQARVRDVLASAGEVRPPDRVERGGTWVGPTSPKTADDLIQMGPEEVLAFLRDWSPTPGPYESTPEGLGRILADVIGRDPAGYVGIVDGFRAVDPTFVRFFFSGLETAVKDSRAFAWAGVLSLAEWVVVQPREIAGRQKALMEADPSWQWTRGAIASLLELGLQERTTELEYEHRDVLWKIIAPLTDDPDPTMDHEAKYGGKNMDPPTMAINTVRGKAFNALLGYALWVRRHLDRPEQRSPLSFDVMPEVRQVLDDHLDLEREPTLTIRSVYGRHFPWLHLLDRVWAQAAVERIFPSDQEQVAYFNAAWDAYLMFCPAYDDVLPVLRAQYAQAVARVGHYDREAKRRRDPQQHLGQHLMTYYWRGRIALDDALLVEFFRLAPDEVRGGALEYAGRSLVNWPEHVEERILRRLRELWEWRLRAAQESGNMAKHRQELAKFGWWFSNRTFDEAWSLEQLRTVLETTQLIAPDFKVSETLEALGPSFPLECVRCATRMAEADRQGWTILANRDHLHAIIRAALVSDNLDARTAAQGLIEHLVARGNFEYRRLLP